MLTNLEVWIFYSEMKLAITFFLQRTYNYYIHVSAKYHHNVYCNIKYILFIQAYKKWVGKHFEGKQPGLNLNNDQMFFINVAQVS